MLNVFFRLIYVNFALRLNVLDKPYGIVIGF